jgi:hypothetical protein
MLSNTNHPTPMLCVTASNTDDMTGSGSALALLSKTSKVGVPVDVTRQALMWRLCHLLIHGVLQEVVWAST